MIMIGKIREFAARQALQRKIYNEMSHMSDAELNDLNLSRAKLKDISRRQAMMA